MEEIEVKFFVDNKESFCAKLLDFGAVKISDEFLMKRTIYEKPGARKGDWLRVRQESDKTTLTFKSSQGLYLGGMNEIEVTVSDFEKTNAILLQTGLEKLAEQENYREVWNLDSAEIVIDKWPWLPLYIEIEGKDKTSVKNVASKLGFDIEKEGVYGTVVNLYQKMYDITADEFHQVKNMTFSIPKPESFESL